MKVLFLTSEFPPYAGGAGEYVYQVSANLCRDCSFDVKVLASTNHFDPDEVRKFDSHFPGRMVRYADLPLRRVKALYYPLTALYRFFKSLLVYLLDKPDVVVACDDSSAKIVFLMHRLLGFRYVVITHGSEFLKESSFYFRALESADFLTFHSLLSKSFLDKARPLLDVDYAVINAGADEKIYDIENPAIFEKASGLRAKLGIDDHAKVILTVGTVSDRKGQDLVIKALADLVAEGRTDLVYVAVGRFRDPSFADLPRQLGVEDNVVFLDFVEREDLPALYAFSDIYVQPSRLSLKLKSIEGFSISTCEAMLLGKPAIVTESVGIQSVLRQLEIGLVAKADDPDDLRDKIMLLADDDTLRQNMGAKSAQIARSNLTWSTTTQDIAKVLTQVSSHNGSSHNGSSHNGSSHNTGAKL